jgi:glutamate-ammonia-ligase adenylyltransferase
MTAEAQTRSTGLTERSLAGRISAAPSGDGGDRRFADWMQGLPAGSVRRDLDAAFETYPKARELVSRLSLFSPYLWDLASADPERLLRVLSSSPDEHLATLLASAAEAAAGTESEPDAMRILRALKAEAALLIALADIGGVWPVMRVTAALTALADHAVQIAVRFLMAAAVRAGRLRPVHPAEIERSSGYIVLAMGKMGAGELNYSSDIDLIVFFDPRAIAVPPDVEAGGFFVRLTRGLVKLLQERTADGYVFRVDLRLRPDPSSTQIAVSTISALDYYDHRGQNWERSALIKARVCAGDFAAGERLLTDLSPFIWRKYMDYVAVADIQTMKRQIHAYKGHSEIAVEGFNVKLGRGGIREIEFFVQTQQLIAGGRHPELRGRETLKTLAALTRGGWIGEDARRDLEAAYLFLRTVEHRLQMIADEQTHTLPAQTEEVERFARFLGFADRAEFSEVFLSHLRKVQGHYSRLFEQAGQRGDGEQKFHFPKDADDEATLDRLSAMGFRNPMEISAIVRGWFAGRYPSLRGEFARAQLAELVPLLIEQISRADSRDAALPAYDRFFATLHGRGGGQLLSLLLQNPELLSLVGLMLGNAPRLADILAHHPQAIDALLDPAFSGKMPDEQKLSAALERSLSQASSYEDLLDRLRLFGQEQMFLVGSRVLSGNASAEQAGQAFAQLADVIIRALHRIVADRFAESYGTVAGQQTAVLAFGKLGSFEMTAASDLDLIIIYDFDQAHPESSGEKPLYGAQYFARFTQRMISALAAPTNYGALYNVDMRLRPSGRSGPVATQIDAFRAYQQEEAWTWEHMALTRARVVSSTPGFATEVEGVIRDILMRPRDARAIAGDALEMRRAIAKEKSEADRWDIKSAAGGLIDIEFIAQYLQLVHAAEHPEILDTSTARALAKAEKLGVLPTREAEILRPAVRLYHDLSQILRLCVSGPFDPKAAGSGLLGLLTRAADVPDFATLDAHLGETQAAVRKSFLRILEGRN